MDFVSVLGLGVGFGEGSMLVSVLVSRTGDKSGLWTWDEWIVDFVDFVSLVLGLGAGLGDKVPGSRYPSPSTLIS